MTLSFECCIDWITCTFPETRNHLELMDFGGHLFESVEYVRTRPSQGYIMAVTDGWGIKYQSGDRLDMGTNVIASGAALTKLRADKGNSWAMVAHCLMVCRACSRIDLAIDVRGEPMLRELITCVRDGAYESGAQNYTIMESGLHGLTLYVGSRSSERFLRIYDKRAQLAIEGETWDRVELEVKGDSATRCARAVAAYGIPRTCSTWIDDFATFDNPTWRKLREIETVPLAKSSRKVTDGRDWLINTIAPIIATRIKAGDRLLLNDILDRIAKDVDIS